MMSRHTPLSTPHRKQFIKSHLLIFIGLFALIGSVYVFFAKAAATSNCTTTVSSIATAQSAVSSAPGGSVICMTPGTYGAIILKGTHSSMVTFQPDPLKDPNGAGKVTFDSIFIQSDKGVAATNITVRNFYVTKGSIRISYSNDTDPIDDPAPRNIVIEHNDITGPKGSYGIHLTSPPAKPWADDIKITGNRIHNLIHTDGVINGAGECASWGSDADAIRLDRFTNVQVTNNEIYRIDTAPAYNKCAGHIDCLQSYNGGVNGAHGLLFDHNYVHDSTCQGPPFINAGAGGDISPNFTVTNNLAVRNLPSGGVKTLWIGGNTTNLIIRNNTYVTTSGSVIAALGSTPNPMAYLDHNVFDFFSNSNTKPYPMTEKYNIFTTGYQFFTKDSTSVVNANPGYVCATSCGNGTKAGDDYRLANNPSGIGIDWSPADYTYGPTLGSPSSPPPPPPPPSPPPAPTPAPPVTNINPTTPDSQPNDAGLDQPDSGPESTGINPTTREYSSNPAVAVAQKAGDTVAAVAQKTQDIVNMTNEQVKEVTTKNKPLVVLTLLVVGLGTIATGLWLRHKHMSLSQLMAHNPLAHKHTVSAAGGSATSSATSPTPSSDTQSSGPVPGTIIKPDKKP